MDCSSRFLSPGRPGPVSIASEPVELSLPVASGVDVLRGSLGVLLDLLQGVLPPVAHTTHELHHVVIRFPGKIPSVAFMKIFVVILHKSPKRVAN